ncbi:hypothetical protein OSTOST_15586, partial [Ostertagia ostertagi]
FRAALPIIRWLEAELLEWVPVTSSPENCPNSSVAVVEPNEKHYYQPGFTMVGGGWMTLEQNTRLEKDLIHPNSVWLHDRVAKFEPKKNMVKLGNGDEITYDYMILATGVQLRWDMIKGLPEALETPGVTSNYSPNHCTKTFKELSTVTSGNCVFTFPNTPLKCAGAPQKVCYYGEELVRKRGYRKQTNFIYATSLPRALQKVAKERNVDVRYGHNLIEVDTKNKVAKFELLDENCVPNGGFSEIPLLVNRHIQFSVLSSHIGPPCSTPQAVRECRELTDEKGWVDVDPQTLRSEDFPNVFAAGDCMNTGNAKTARSSFQPSEDH